ncbi:MAG: CotH kinase family protein [Oscillospiraceae bacterium]|nr:CotH kinase family protein [Oscillospiraceae bacterium]
MPKRTIFSILLLSAIMLGVIMFIPLGGQSSVDSNIAFSLPGGLHNGGDVVAVLNIPTYGQVRYTLDSTVPRMGSPVYRSPFTLPEAAEPRGDATVIRAQLFVRGEPVGNEIIATYFTGVSLDRLNMPVISLVSDPHNFYDYVYGIYVYGHVRTQWVADNPDEEVTPRSPANRNQRGRAWERDVHIELFDVDMTPLAVQAAGVRVAGTSSRTLPGRALRLFGREEHSGDLYFPLFDDLYDRQGRAMTDFASLTLRNSGNDFNNAFIRDALVNRLAAESGFNAVSAYRPVVIFRNGQYKGIRNMREHWGSPQYLEAHFGVDASSVTVLTDGIGDPRLSFGRERDFDDFKELHQWMGRVNLARDANVAYLNRFLDVDNFMRYAAIQIVSGNSDWPQNNVLIWRGLGNTPYGDGRWRFVLKDFDFALGFASQSWRDTLGHVTSRSRLFRGLLSNPTWQAAFVTEVERLLATYFHPYHIIATANEMRLHIVQEMEHFVPLHDILSFERQDNSFARLYHYAMVQPAFLAERFYEQLGVTLQLPTQSPPPLPSLGSYTFPHNSVILGGSMFDSRSQRMDGVLSVNIDGEWISIEAYAEANNLLVFVHAATDSVIFSPQIETPERPELS